MGIVERSKMIFFNPQDSAQRSTANPRKPVSTGTWADQTWKGGHCQPPYPHPRPDGRRTQVNSVFYWVSRTGSDQIVTAFY